MPRPVQVMWTTEDVNAAILLSQLLEEDQTHTSRFEQGDALEQAASQLSRTIASVVGMLQGQAAGESITGDFGPAQVRVLYALSNSALRTSEVAKLLNVGVSTMAHIVEPLLERGYVERAVVGDGERRTVQLSLTGPGSELARTMREQFRQALKDCLSPLSEQDLHDIAKTCSHLVSLLPSSWSEKQPVQADASV